jgi:hypothetical protein
MPIVIDDVMVEVSDSAAVSGAGEPLQQQLPASAAEQEMLETLALIQQRQNRLRVD